MDSIVDHTLRDCCDVVLEEIYRISGWFGGKFQIWKLAQTCGSCVGIVLVLVLHVVRLVLRENTNPLMC